MRGGDTDTGAGAMSDTETVTDITGTGATGTSGDTAATGTAGEHGVGRETRSGDIGVATEDIGA